MNILKTLLPAGNLKPHWREASHYGEEGIPTYLPFLPDTAGGCPYPLRVCIFSHHLSLLLNSSVPEPPLELEQGEINLSSRSHQHRKV